MLSLEKLSKSYHHKTAVDALSLQVQEGETLALIGPSGCGKSTLLRLIAGLTRPDAGRVSMNNRDITSLPAQRRGFGMVFQDFALFPHLNVHDNVAYGLVERKWSKTEQRQRVKALLSLVGLEADAARSVQELSGGEKQRVALARALAPEPSLLLFDEPLSNLDFALREDLKQQLKQLLGSLAVSAIYVTHDQGEAFALANRIAVMRSGSLLQCASAQDLYKQPRSAWIARFLGHENIYPAHVWQRSSASVLLRQELVRIGSGGHRAEVLDYQQRADKHFLRLRLDNGQCLHWQGYQRELQGPVQQGQMIDLEIPAEAVVELADER